MIISNIKKLYSLRNKKAKDSLGRPITLFVLFSLILSVFVYTGGKMNEVVSDANGGKMPVYDKNYYDGMYRDDPKHQNAD